METPSKPSAAALKVVESFNGTLGYNLLIDDEITKLAALIDAALAPLRQAAREFADYQGNLRGYWATRKNDLNRALAPWEPESGGGM